MKTSKSALIRLLLALVFAALASVWLSGCIIVPDDDHDRGWHRGQDWDHDRGDHR